MIQYIQLLRQILRQLLQLKKQNFLPRKTLQAAITYHKAKFIFVFPQLKPNQKISWNPAMFVHILCI